MQQVLSLHYNNIFKSYTILSRNPLGTGTKLQYVPGTNI